MLIFRTIKELRTYLEVSRNNDERIGFVPTMGALHKGHLSLIRTSKIENDITICSIYVNPTQFNNREDFEKYPKILEKDIELLETECCDVLFAPSDKEMYPQGWEHSYLDMHFGKIEEVLEGAYRKGHFQGVGLIVSKLFNIVSPDRAYFGLKDLQQCFIIKKLIEDLSYQIELRLCPTVREVDGLAMSSRNTRLSPWARAIAPRLYGTLKEMQKDLEGGTSLRKCLDKGRRYLNNNSTFKLEYLEAVSFDSFEVLERVQKPANIALCLAVWLDNVRLIDNIVFELR